LTDLLQPLFSAGHQGKKAAQIFARRVAAFGAGGKPFVLTATSDFALAAIAEHFRAARKASVAVDVVNFKGHAEKFGPLFGHFLSDLIVVFLCGKVSGALGAVQSTAGVHFFFLLAVKNLIIEQIKYLSV
jgi:hypothetical protein